MRNSGYKNNEIEDAKKRALSLKRSDLLKLKKKSETSDDCDAQKQLVFSVNRNEQMSKHIRAILSNNQTDIDKLLGGPTRLIVAQRKQNSTASLIFAKSSFSKCIVKEAENQKCCVGGCLTCRVMNLPKKVTLWKNNSTRKNNCENGF